MDAAGKDDIEGKKGDEDSIHFHAPSMPPDWHISGSSLTNPSLGMIPSGNPVAACKEDLLESSSCSSFCPTAWEPNTSSQNLGFFANVQNNASGIPNPLGTRTSGLDTLGADAERTLDMNWIPPNSMLKEGMFLPTSPGMLPQSLAQFTADSGFIERAARFSCFSGGNLGDMMNPFSTPDSMNPYSRCLAPMPGHQEVFATNGLKTISSLQPQNNDMNRVECSKDASLPVEFVAKEGSPLKNEKKNENFVSSPNQAKQCMGMLVNDSEEAEFSGRGGEEELEGAGRESSAKGLGSKKRKRTGQDPELDEHKGSLKPQPQAEGTKDHREIQQKGDQNLTSTTSKPGGKNGKPGSQASDPPKEEYIHVRARRGQATNSHSLAERVRREKISERMKFLQDLVPGCSKVTGKAVMLDEIINYVQSLQRQVEFLSMKLATVNPRMDFNIDGILAKDILQSRVVPSSSPAFPAENVTMPYHPLHTPQLGPVQAGLHCLGNTSDALRRPINSQLTMGSGGYKDPTSQVPSMWEDELNNVVQMGFNSSAPGNSQDLSGPLPPGHMKTEQ